MKTYISLLRGINVSGHKKIAMADLKALYEDLGFKNITTYIQSGNVVFESESNANIDQMIAKAIFKAYQFEVPVVVKTVAELNNIIKNNPFVADGSIDPDKLHVTFLATKPDPKNIAALATKNYEPDQYHIIDTAVYLHCPNGYGRTKLNNSFFENKLKTIATTRNWKTTQQLLALAETTGKLD